jgi:uncharacterized protein
MGLSTGKLRYYVPLGLIIGIALGGIEYQILYPNILSHERIFGNTIAISLIIMVFSAIVEEFIFRSVLQTGLQDTLGPIRSLLLTSVLFGIMYGSYGIFSLIIFASITGFLFGFIFQRTKSLPFITLAHGISNIFLIIAIAYASV